MYLHQNFIHFLPLLVSEWLLFSFQTLLTSDTAAIKDDEGRTVLLTAAELGIKHFLSLFIIIISYLGPIAKSFNCINLSIERLDFFILGPAT